MLPDDPSEGARTQMVQDQLVARDVRDIRVLDAMRTVPRHRFVPATLVGDAYTDQPLPIGQGQTISQPYIVALMAELLQIRPTGRVLEIGTGSGYSAAVLAHLGHEVVSVERHGALAQHARATLADVGITNVEVHVADGTLGWPLKSPYDAISVTASGPAIPQELLDQLAVGGRLVIPVGEQAWSQHLLLVERAAPDKFAKTNVCPVRFVPLIGARGWRDEQGLSS